MQAYMEKLIHIKLEGGLDELPVKVDPRYAQYVTYEGKKKLVYGELLKVLYSTVQASYLSW